ncbi:MAG: DUF3800 domain-containing protein, partial [Candidatus Margulisbacteria bacterium]|nr:DUF3800 domain-containing protein [Candidatus Margulisiibacteriota bacterium]
MDKIYIYCDESRHIMNCPNKYMVLGSIWFHASNKEKIKMQFNNLLVKYQYTSEIKWTILSDRRLEFYKELVDLFSKLPLFFRAIVVDKTKIDLKMYHSNNAELSHTKFIYLLLKELVNDENEEYIILLDYKDRDTNKRLHELRKFLSMQCMPSSRIKQLQEVASHENIFIQLADLFIGAIGYDMNQINTSRAKMEFCSYLKDTFNIDSFRRTTPKQEIKFNLFNI